MKFHKRSWLALVVCALFATTTVACGGEDGLDGAEGPAGEQGEQGAKGEKGDEGPAGSDGVDGVDGEDGQDGVDGQDGEDGRSALVVTEELEPGAQCAMGGVAIHSGFDLDGDGELSEEEIESSEYLCTAEPCAEPFLISEILGSDQQFYDELESEPLSLVTNTSENISIILQSGDAHLTSRNADGSFTITPTSLNDTEITLLAASACGADTITFLVEDVADPNASVRFVHIADTVGVVEFSRDDGTVYSTRPYGSASSEVAVLPGSFAFTILHDDQVMATSGVVDIEIAGTYTLIAYSDAGEANLFLLEEDDDRAVDEGNDAASSLRTLLLSQNDEPLTLDIGDAFSEVLDFGAPSDANDADIVGATEITLTEEDDSQTLLDVEGDLFGADDIVNIFVVRDAFDGLRLFVQDLNSSSSSTLTLLTMPVTFEEVTDSFGVDGIWSTDGSAEWTGTTNHFTTDGMSLSSGRISGSQSSYLYLEVELTEPSVLTFDWRASSEASTSGVIFDGLAFCLENTSCTKSSADDVIGGDLERNNEFGEVWIEYESEVLDSGTHTFTWVYFKDFSVNRGDDMGWVDNVAIQAAP